MRDREREKRIYSVTLNPLLFCGDNRRLYFLFSLSRLASERSLRSFSGPGPSELYTTEYGIRGTCSNNNANQGRHADGLHDLVASERRRSIGGRRCDAFIGLEKGHGNNEHNGQPSHWRYFGPGRPLLLRETR